MDRRKKKQDLIWHFLFITLQTNHDANIKGVLYIFLACGICLCRTASQLLLCIPSYICFVPWEYITYSHFCGKRILWILARQEAVWLDQILPCSRFFIQARVFFQIHNVLLQERGRKGICTVYVCVYVWLVCTRHEWVHVWTRAGCNVVPEHLSSD